MYLDEESQIERLQSTFREMREDGWNPEADLLWGYFFVDKSRDKLATLGRHLDQLGYRLVEIFELEEEETGAPAKDQMLHVERVETHSPTTLAQRNVMLSALTREFDVEAYDGWDVGKVESSTAN